MAAPAKMSTLALTSRSIEVKRFRLNAGAVFIFLVLICRLTNLSREDYETVIIGIKLFFLAVLACS
jgi:hypothetical protein